jgi:hypothetical protein
MNPMSIMTIFNILMCIYALIYDENNIVLIIGIPTLLLLHFTKQSDVRIK